MRQNLQSLNANNGVAISDLLGEPVGAKHVLGAVDELKAVYRVDFASGQYSTLLQTLQRRLIANNWSSVRFRQALDWVLDNFKFPTWTVADFISAPMESLKPYSWVLDEMQKDNTAMERMEAYKIEGVEKPLWRYEDGTTLPFDRVVERGKQVNR